MHRVIDVADGADELNEQRAARDWLRQIIELIPLGVVVVDATGRVLMASTAGYDTWGRTIDPEDPDGLPRLNFAREDGSPWPFEESALGRALSGEVVHDEQVCLRNLATGETRSLLVSAAPLRRDGGSVSAAVAASQDISALKEVERLKDDFIATASHDLKAPLTSIKGYAQLLLRRLAEPTPDLAELAEGLEVVNAQTAVMVRLLDNLLDSARVQAGGLDPRLVPTDFAELLSRVLANMTPADRRRVDVALPDEPLVGHWEGRKIEQVLANLVANALKYSPEDTRVSVHIGRRRNDIEVAVRDAGMGLGPDQIPRLFQRFYRAPEAQESGVPGTGLGLYICHGILDAHGGRVWAESAGPGLGSAFHFTLPLAPCAGAGG